VAPTDGRAVKLVAFAALAVVAAAGLLARSVTPVAACTCVPFSAENAAIRADLVVIGTVTDEIWRQGDSSPNNDCGATGGQSGAILVERYIEGSGGERIEFFNQPGKSYC